MSAPFLAEIRIFGFNFAPQGWALCDGQLLPISQNTALFSLLGTNFGGDTRIGYTRPVFGWTASAFLGGNVDHCNCEFGNAGTQEGLGGGLSVWDAKWEGSDDVTDAMLSRPSASIDYAACELAVIDSYSLHQIEPFGGEVDRVSATVHALKNGERWEAWF